MKKVILALLILLVVVLKVQSHSDSGKFYKFGSVTSFILWGFYEHEERNKAIIISMLADSLLEKHHYSNNVNLGFTHSYTDKSIETFSVSLVSYDKETPQLKIDLKGYQYDTEKVLKLLEYAIVNMKDWQKQHNQNSVVVEEYFDVVSMQKRSCRIFRIPNFIVENALKRQPSDVVKGLLLKKMYRPSDDLTKLDNSSISYYLQNDQYHILHRMSMNGKEYELEVLILDNLFQYVPIPRVDRAMIFDTDSSFYFLNYFNAKSVKLSRKIIPSLTVKYYPYQVSFPGQSMVTFSKMDKLKTGFSNERYFVYRIDDEYLVTDLDAVINQIKSQSNN
jgi:hypothetical protein